ncbi:hypothetical protein [Pseudomonas sp. RV120224-01c]
MWKTAATWTLRSRRWVWIPG